jgi:hypothetical protein
MSLSDDWPYWNGTISLYFLHSVHLMTHPYNLDLLFFFNTVIHRPIAFTILKIMPHDTIFSPKFLTVQKRDWENYHSTTATPSVGHVHKKGAARVQPFNGWVDSVTNSLVSLQFQCVSTKPTNTFDPLSHFRTSWTQFNLHEDGGKTSLHKVRANLSSYMV